MMLPNWIRKYVGIPFKERSSSFDGCDCYGLFRLIYNEQYSICLPDYTDQYDSTKNGETIHHLIERESLKWEKVRDEKEGDAVLFRCKNLIWHIGFVLIKDLMIHTEEDIDACIEKIDSIRWRNRTEGFYRYNG